MVFGTKRADSDDRYLRAVFEKGTPTSSVGRGARALSPDTRCGPPGLRSFEAACASSSMAPLVSYAGSQGTGTPPGISSEELISAADNPTHH